MSNLLKMHNANEDKAIGNTFVIIYFQVIFLPFVNINILINFMQSLLSVWLNS